jgi:hypothetical protein
MTSCRARAEVAGPKNAALLSALHLIDAWNRKPVQVTTVQQTRNTKVIQWQRQQLARRLVIT